MFAGSLLNLEPDTEYECHFVLADPDGVKGKAEKTVNVRTRKEPMPAEGGHVYHVYPFGYKGTRQEPSFTGIDGRVLHGLRPVRPLERISAARPAGRHHSGPRRTLQGQSLRL